jgi:hypothetical protein
VVCGMHGRGEKSVQGLVGKPEGKRLLRRLRHTREDGFRMDHRETGWGEGVWSGSSWLTIGAGGRLL